jgi:hypothetical protein
MKLVTLFLLAVTPFLGGCVGSSLILEYEHHSSAQDYYDQNTSDMAGLVFNTPLRFKPEHCDLYCPELEVGLFWELTDKPVFGRDPVGTLRLRQPLIIR